MDFRALETVLQTGQVERRELAGRQHLVAPVVLVREMVLNGGYLPADEIQSSAVAWNGRPITVNHPERDGEFAPANQPEFLETQTIGRLFNAEFAEDLPETERASERGARAEAWVDEQRALDMGGEAAKIAEFLAAHADAEGDEPSENEEHVMDVSTGYWHDFQAETGRFMGQQYEEVQFDLHPDHLAFLPNQEGACSVADGCGVPRVQQRLAAHSEHYTGMEPMTPAANELTPEQAALVESALEEFVDAQGNATVDDLHEWLFQNDNLDPDTATALHAAFDELFESTPDEWTIEEFRDWLGEQVETDAAADAQVATSLGRRVMDWLGITGQTGPDAGGSGVAADGGSRTQAHGANCSCGKHESTSTTHMSDPDIETLAEQTAFDADELSEMDESTLAKVAETVEAFEADADGGGDGGDGSGNDNGSGADNDGGDTPDDDGEYVTRDDLESFKDEIIDSVQREQRSDEVEAVVQALTEATDLDEEQVRSLAESADSIDALIELAQNVGGDDAAQVGAATGVNWLGRGAPASAQANADEDGEDDDWEDFVGNIGVLNRQANGGDD